MDNEEKVKAVETKLKEVFDIMGMPDTEGLSETPHRISKMWCNEIFKNNNPSTISDLYDSMTYFNTESKTAKSGLIIVRDIPFVSFCEHHWLPFFGTVTVAYIPSTKIIGLSKIPRVVQYFSKRPQLQERLTEDIRTFLRDNLHPLALFVEIKATHTCVMCRGAESEAETETLSWFGDEKYYDEFINRR